MNPEIVFVLGGPGAGKSTQCQLISDELGYVHFSVGELLREERLRPGSQYGALIESHFEEGSIVPVEISCNLLKLAMEECGWQNGKFLVDGFPRNMDNLAGWKKAMDGLVEEKLCLFFDCPESVMEERVLARRETCGRSDDNIQTFRKRVKTCVDSTMPVVEMFRKEGKLRVVNTDRTVPAVYADIKHLLKE